MQMTTLQLPHLQQRLSACPFVRHIVVFISKQFMSFNFFQHMGEASP